MSKRPQPRPTSTGAGGTAGPSGPGSSYGGSGSTPTATHILASAIALPPQTGLVRLQSQLTEMARQVTPFVQREVFCQRMDDEDETRKAVEQDAMYAPIRRARLQSRLRLRFERSKVDLRLYSKPNGKGLDSMDLYNLVCVPLECQSETTSQRKRASTAKDALLAEIDAGANEWKQIVRAMGWEPHSTLVRRGHRFVLRDDPACRVEAQLFQLYKVSVLLACVCHSTFLPC